MAQHSRMGLLARLGERWGMDGAAAVRTCLVGAIVLVLAVVSLGSGVFASRTLTIERADAVGEPEAGAASGEDVGTAGDADDDEDADDPAAKDADDSDEEIVVDISGAVREPMVVALPAGSRVQDAIEAAGGLAEDADLAQVNRAATLADGAKIVVPCLGETAPAGGSTGSVESGSGGTASLVNINTASAEELDALPGVGPSTASAIIEDREANGPFSSPEDLMRVSGIGEKKYAKIEGLICV